MPQPPWPTQPPPRTAETVAKLFFRHEGDGGGPLSLGRGTLNGPLIAELLKRERPWVFNDETVELLFNLAGLDVEDLQLGAGDFSNLLGFDAEHIHDDFIEGVWLMKDWLVRDDRYVVSRDEGGGLDLEVVKNSGVRLKGPLRRDGASFIADVTQTAGEPHDPTPKTVRVRLEGGDYKPSPGNAGRATRVTTRGSTLGLPGAEAAAPSRGTRPRQTVFPGKAPSGEDPEAGQAAPQRGTRPRQTFVAKGNADAGLGSNDGDLDDNADNGGPGLPQDGPGLGSLQEEPEEEDLSKPDVLVTCQKRAGTDIWGREEVRVRVRESEEDSFLGQFISDQFGVRFSILRAGDGSILIHWLQYTAVLTRDRPWLVGHSMGADGKPRKHIRIYPQEDGSGGLCMQYLKVSRKAENAWITPPTKMRRLTEEELKADGRYVATDSLWQVLRTGDTKLLRGRWIVKRNEEDEPLPRRQELPPEAFWDPMELERHVRSHDVLIVALSYCWEEEDHPDPYGRQLEILAGVIERRLELKYPNGRPALLDVAVFIDWCSLHQRPYGSDAERASFERGLQDCYLWFAHQTSECWLLMSTAVGMVEYSKRGWPYFEVEISSMITPQHMLINIGRWRSNIQDWFRLFQACRMDRSVPETPDDFLGDLRKKRFSHPEDLEFLEKKYSQVFEEVMGSAQVLSFSEITHWEGRDWELLSHMLPLCRRLKRFSMVGDHMDGISFTPVAAVMPQCASLKVLELSSNPLGDDGAQALAASLPEFPCIEMLVLEDCEVKEAGAQALAKALPKAANLQELWLAHNNIGNSGGFAFAQILASCALLRVLLLTDNQIGGQTAKRLHAAWAAAGKLDKNDEHYNLDV